MSIFIFIVTALTAVFATPASAADWYLAETEHFNIYAEDDRDAVEEFARELGFVDKA